MKIDEDSIRIGIESDFNTEDLYLVASCPSTTEQGTLMIDARVVIKRKIKFKDFIRQVLGLRDYLLVEANRGVKPFEN